MTILEKVNLINGTFTQKEAKEILMNMLSSKIQFHERKILSNFDRHGEKDEYSKLKIQTLKSQMNHVNDFIMSLNAEEDMLEIISDIEIKRIKK